MCVVQHIHDGWIWHVHVHVACKLLQPSDGADACTAVSLAASCAIAEGVSKISPILALSGWYSKSHTPASQWYRPHRNVVTRPQAHSGARECPARCDNSKAQRTPAPAVSSPSPQSAAAHHQRPKRLTDARSHRHSGASASALGCSTHCSGSASAAGSSWQSGPTRWRFLAAVWFV